MKKITLLAVLFITTLSYGQELITDGGFEDVADSDATNGTTIAQGDATTPLGTWYSSANFANIIGITTSEQDKGDHAILLDNTTGKSASLKQNFILEAGTYVCSYRIKKMNADVGDDSKVLKGYIRRSVSSLEQQVTAGETGTIYSIGTKSQWHTKRSLLSETAYTTVSFQFKVAAADDGELFHVFIALQPDETGSPLYIDNVSMHIQEDAWIFLKDKPDKATFINNPLKMLSQRALDRRSKLAIPIDFIDVPVDETYYNQIKNDGNLTVLAKSKWLNAIHIQGQVEDINNLLSTYSFIDNIEFANKSLNTFGKSTTNSKTIISNHHNKFNETLTDFNYGDADNQIKMLKGDYLHDQGLTGEGQVIAIIDGGFPNVNILEAFQRIRDNNQILGGYNFADRNENFYTRNSHGTHVLSSVAGYLENEFVGTAPDAKFYLFISEIVETETVLEETLWVEAAERADSLGVDVINTSLGYTTYDNPNHSHTYADLDGKTTFITRGAEIGASRGMLLVNAAGNSGSSSWKYIGAPADAPSVITVGAVNASGEMASFSSFGPTSDGRIKPEILGQGQNPALINYISGAITTASSGTSFSSPIMAGLIACLNQNESGLLKTSSKTSDNLNEYLKKSVYESADKYSNPLDQYGYGIPNFEVALNSYIGSTAKVYDSTFSKLTIYPNPTTELFTISSDIVTLNDFTIQVFNILGKKVLEKVNLTSRNIDISFLESGIYMLKISKENQQKTFRLIKK